MEVPVNGYTDLVIEKEGERMAIEIETGKSDWQKNIDKNLKKGFQQIIIYATNDKTYLKIKEVIKQEPLRQQINIHQAQDLL
jgi:hypothetical protein